jgi:putative membrane protein
MSTAVGVEPRRRLHPLSPLLRGVKLVAVVVAAISVQGFAQLGLFRWLGMVVIVAVGVVAVSAISWLVTGYHVLGRELRVYEGLLYRRTRAIPLERLQAVEVVRPLLARLAGLAELRLEVVGGAKTEAPLAYLTVADAVALRKRLVALSGAGRAPAAAVGDEAGAPPEAAPAPAPPAERHLHTVDNRDVLVSQLLTPQVLFLPVGLFFLVVQFWFGGAWSLVALLGLLTAIIGTVGQPVRRILADWNFRLAVDPAGLRVRHGLTETRSQIVPLHRVQAVAATWPLLWRGMRWLRCRLDVAGYSSSEQDGRSADRLLPVGDLATARRLLAEVLPVDLTALPLVGPPARARWVAPWRQPILGAGLTEHVFTTRDGRLTREVVVVPYARIQSVRIVQGPLQRQLGLATVHADTAGSVRAAAHHRDLAEARALAAELTARARAARAAHAAVNAPPGELPPARPADAPDPPGEPPAPQPPAAPVAPHPPVPGAGSAAGGGTTPS